LIQFKISFQFQGWSVCNCWIFPAQTFRIVMLCKHMELSAVISCHSNHSSHYQHPRKNIEFQKSQNTLEVFITALNASEVLHLLVCRIWRAALSDSFFSRTSLLVTKG